LPRCEGDSADERRSDTEIRGRGRCGRPQLVVVPGGEVKEILVTESPLLLSQRPSLLDRIVDPLAHGFALRCIPPECRWNGETRIGPSSFLSN
jgi:hypothetical protein